MMSPLIPILLMASFLVLQPVHADPSLVIEFIRHGARSPIISQPFFKNITWDYPGELTPIGERQHNLLGRLRRQQYIERAGFLPEEYDPALISAYSTHFNRTQMSLQSYLLGLYPNGLAQLNDMQKRHSEDLLAPPIPLTIGKYLIKQLDRRPMPYSIPMHAFHTREVPDEGMLLFESCPYAEAAKQKEYYGSGKYLETFQKYSDTWQKLITSYPEISMEYLKSGRNAIDIADLLLCANSEGKRPYKITDEMLVKFQEFIGVVMKEEITIPTLALNISLSWITKEITGRMVDTICGRSKVKYAVYAGHDTTLIILMLGMHLLNSTVELTKRPDVAGNMLFELDTDRKVSVFYNGNLIHNEPFATFEEKFLAIGNMTITREDACTSDYRSTSQKYMLRHST